MRIKAWLGAIALALASACTTQPAFAQTLTIIGVPATTIVGDTVHPTAVYTSTAGVKTYCKSCWFATTVTTVAARTSPTMLDYGTWSKAPGATIPIVALIPGTTAIYGVVQGTTVSGSVQLTVLPKAITPPPDTLPNPPPVVTGTNMPTGMTIVCQTGPVTAMTMTGGTAGSPATVAFGGPKPCTWSKNGPPTGTIGLAAGAKNPDGSANTDPQKSGYRVMFPAGQVNDPAWGMYTGHAGGTGTYYISWLERQAAGKPYPAIQSIMNSLDSKAWAPKGPSGDLTIMSWMDFSYFSPTPIIGLNFQGADDANIPDNNLTGKSGTIPATAAMALPGVLSGSGAWDQEEVLIVSSGNLSASSVSFFVNGKLVAKATGVTDASTWNETDQYVSRSVYGGVQKSTTHMDFDQVTIAVK
jgi:hypothetical protein